jgi:hypothetical protein
LRASGIAQRSLQGRAIEVGDEYQRIVAIHGDPHLVELTRLVRLAGV